MLLQRQKLSRWHHNLYKRKNQKPGFHTNRESKNDVVFTLISWIRDRLFIEHDVEAIDEFSWFEFKSGGSYGAITGKHDDIVMSRGIAIKVAIDNPLTPKLNPADFMLA